MSLKFYIVKLPRLDLKDSVTCWKYRALIMIGRQNIIRDWKAPGTKDWVTEMGKVIAYERMSYSNGIGAEKYWLTCERCIAVIVAQEYG